MVVFGRLLYFIMFLETGISLGDRVIVCSKIRVVLVEVVKLGEVVL